MNEQKPKRSKKSIFFKGIYYFIHAIFRIPYAVFAIILISAVAYFFGYSYLSGIRGTDTSSVLGLVYWYERWWPQIPYWFPLQNGGVVPLWGYPLFSHFAIIILHRVFNISLVAALDIIGLSSVLLSSLGLYFFASFRLKNQTVGLIGALLYLLSPISWVWLYRWGFYAEMISYIWFFPTLLFYDVAYQSFLNAKKFRLWDRVSLLLAVICLGLAFFTHPNTFFVISAVLFIYSLIVALYKGRTKIDKFLKGTLFPICFILLTILMFSFIIMNYLYYQKITTAWKQDGFNHIYTNSEKAEMKKEMIYNLNTPIDVLLGFKQLPPTDFKSGHNDIVVTPASWIPALPGLVLAAIYSPIVFGLGLMAALAYLIFWIPETGWYIGQIVSPIFPNWSYIIQHRPLIIIMRMITPLLGAFGLWAVWKFLIDIPTFWIKKGILLRFKKLLVAFIGTFGALILFGILVVYCRNIPVNLWGEFGVRYGPTIRNIKDPFEQKLSPEIQTPEEFSKYITNFQNWPKVKLTDNYVDELNGFLPFVQSHKNEGNVRIEVSPGLGGVTMALPMVSDFSNTNLYIFTLSLLDSYYGYEQQVFYGKDNSSITVNNIARWFGIKYLFLNPGNNPTEQYENDPENWQSIRNGTIWEFLTAPKLYSWTVHKPAVLVIASHKLRAFEPFFRIAVNGGYAYDDGWLIQGKENIDDYSLDELKKFDTVVLFGYSYKNRKAAFNMLDKYIKEGGSVFIDTGWQYTDKDWQLSDTPDFFPVNGTKWSGNQKLNGSFSLDDTDFGDQVDVSQIPPLSVGSQSWGVSIPENGLKDWAKPVLSYDGTPLVAAGQYGLGKVIWAGVNFPGHIHANNYKKDELQFLNNLLVWFGRGDQQEEKNLADKITLVRDYPDRVEFDFNGKSDAPSSLYWREAQMSNWQASLIDPSGRHENLQIYRAGPNFSLLRLPALESGSKVVLEFKPGMISLFANILSLLTFAIFIIYIILGQRFLMVATRPISKLFVKYKYLFTITTFKKKIEWVNKTDDEETY